MVTLLKFLNLYISEGVSKHNKINNIIIANNVIMAHKLDLNIIVVHLYTKYYSITSLSLELVYSFF